MPTPIIRIFGRGFNFSQDGPGNRLVYHLAGCNFRCPWCSNPECFAPDTRITERSVAELHDEILRSRPMFFSGGGVTFTGGEPTMQFAALRELLVLLKEDNIHTAMECNASHPKLSGLFPLVDFLMADLKHTDSDRHRAVVGAGNEATLANIRAAAKTRQLALRIPLINGFNTDDAAIEGFIRFLAPLERNPKFTVELLPYHEYGRVKWAQHRMEYTVTDGFVHPERLAEIRRRFLSAGIPLIHT